MGDKGVKELADELETGEPLAGKPYKVIINGGESLPGCPHSSKQAHEWADKANGDAEETHPRWSWDCGYKLNYDGALIEVSSRFYPPKAHYGPTWDGSVFILMMNKIIAEKKFDCPTLEELKKQVTEYVNGFADKLKNLLEEIDA